ncbi:hypothetical protein DOTSEDRAFT_72435 [Dothistroma septosporum NZE10]|uniref:Uncharacterized protein n=1 Tax=Dothistroma septosporum (strain NZE10 / CBS 128990) TaxID=675120 RepID=M2Y420_DOTSN|nr:hypothetical protein DOTSEDRAFT_72435 [Dothistroma septosporum NZE10]
MSTEDLAQTLLARLNTSGRLSSTTATSLTEAVASAVSSRAESTATTIVHDVFHTAELLKAILLNNNLMDVTSSQRVSKQFQATITGSTRLQDRLWLRPRPSPTMRCQMPTYKCRGKGRVKNFQPKIRPLLSDSKLHSGPSRSYGR